MNQFKLKESQIYTSRSETEDTRYIFRMYDTWYCTFPSYLDMFEDDLSRCPYAELLSPQALFNYYDCVTEIFCED